MLAAYYCRTRGFNVGLFANYSRFPGDRSWECTSHYRSDEVYDLLLDLINLIIAQSLSKEIEATIKFKLKSNIQLRNRYCHIRFLDGNYDLLPAELFTIGPALNFDMGRQKRSTGLIYI